MAFKEDNLGPIPGTDPPSNISPAVMFLIVLWLFRRKSR